MSGPDVSCGPSSRKLLWIAAEIVNLKAPPYELPVQRLVDFKQPGHRVDPELVVAVPFQDRVGDSPVHLAVQVLRRNLKQKKTKPKNKTTGLQRCSKRK